jgi:hypothetical protein
MSDTKALEYKVGHHRDYCWIFHGGSECTCDADKASIELKNLTERIFSLYVVLNERKNTIVQLRQQFEDIKIANLALREEQIGVRNMWHDTIEDNKKLRQSLDVWKTLALKAYKQLMERRAQLDRARLALQKIKNAVCGDRRPENDFQNTAVRGWTADVCDEGLAELKRTT